MSSHPALGPVEPGGGTSVDHFVAGTVSRLCRHGANIDDLGLGTDLHAPLLGKIEVILDQRVLPILAATYHTGTAVGASPSRRAFTLKIGVGYLLPLLAEEHPYLGGTEGLPLPQFLGDFLQGVVRRRETGVAGHTEHAAGGLVVRGQDDLPVGQMLPQRVVEEAVAWHLQHVGIAEAAPTDASTVQDSDAIEDGDLQNAKQAQCGRPKVFPRHPVAAGEVLVPIALPAFQHQHTVAFLSEAHGRDTAAKA